MTRVRWAIIIAGSLLLSHVLGGCAVVTVGAWLVPSAMVASDACSRDTASSPSLPASVSSAALSSACGFLSLSPDAGQPQSY